MGVSSMRERRKREKKSESKRGINVRCNEVDVDVTMELRRLYAP